MTDKESTNPDSQEPKQTFLGMPMQWDLKNWHKDFWNPESDELFPPKKFGIGWGVNFHAVLRIAGIFKNTKNHG